jgi:hypothetical protein
MEAILCRYAEMLELYDMLMVVLVPYCTSYEIIKVENTFQCRSHVYRIPITW